MNFWPRLRAIFGRSTQPARPSTLALDLLYLGRTRMLDGGCIARDLLSVGPAEPSVLGTHVTLAGETFVVEAGPRDFFLAAVANLRGKSFSLMYGDRITVEISVL